MNRGLRILLMGAGLVVGVNLALAWISPYLEERADGYYTHLECRGSPFPHLGMQGRGPSDALEALLKEGSCEKNEECALIAPPGCGGAAAFMSVSSEKACEAKSLVAGINMSIDCVALNDLRLIGNLKTVIHPPQAVCVNHTCTIR